MEFLHAGAYRGTPVEEKGYIETKAGITEGNFRAWLTDEAKDVLLAFPYVPPILRDK